MCGPIVGTSSLIYYTTNNVLMVVVVIPPSHKAWRTMSEWCIISMAQTGWDSMGPYWYIYSGQRGQVWWGHHLTDLHCYEEGGHKQRGDMHGGFLWPSRGRGKGMLKRFIIYMQRAKLVSRIFMVIGSYHALCHTMPLQINKALILSFKIKSQNL